MERLCFTFELRAGAGAEYKRRHDHIWPELVADLKAAGMSNYSLFAQDERIVAYAECHPDVATCLAAVALSEVNARWGTWFEDLIVALVDETGELHRLTELWHLG